MNRLLSLLSVLLLSAGLAVAQPFNPAASPQAQVVSGNARFTVLTDRLIRMEWSPSGQFEDRATLAIVNRNLPVPRFTVQQGRNGLTIKTAAVTLTYRGNDAFSADNLKASFKMKGKTVTWHPGLDASGNLLGTARTLDGCSGPEQINYSDPMEPGILSRDGWAVVDESARHIFGRRTGSLPVRLRARLQGRAGRFHESGRQDAAPAQIRVRLLVEPLLGLHR